MDIDKIQGQLMTIQQTLNGIRLAVIQDMSAEQLHIELREKLRVLSDACTEAINKVSGMCDQQG